MTETEPTLQDPPTLLAMVAWADAVVHLRGAAPTIGYTPDAMTIQLYGCELVLQKDGRWFLNDTGD